MKEWAVIVDEALGGGAIGLLPTDTVYGLAAALDSEDGIAALYALKGRPRSQPCQVLVYHPARLEEALAPLDPRTRDAARALLPGPATCLVPDPAGRFAAAGGDAPGSVGVRAPRFEGPLTGVELFLVATSANDPGGPDPARLDQVPRRIRDAVGLEVDAGDLPGTASAVIDLREVAAGGPARLLRPGPDPEAVAAALAPLGIAVVHPG
ncbi:MAG TPA: Sua5/YciO/YrdC/YwlC family protein [Miltoncostaeaceae bacterium]|nr:Sua5/YciO/YrdC/YwlC family protein [Miltoncostaeaceae bacterium]